MEKEEQIFEPPRELGPGRIVAAALIYGCIIMISTMIFLSAHMIIPCIFIWIICILLFSSGIFFTEPGWLYTPRHLFNGLLGDLVVIGGRATYLFWPFISLKKKDRVDGKVRPKSFVIFSLSKAKEEKGAQAKGGALMRVTGKIFLRTVHPIQVIMMKGRERAADITCLDILDSSSRPYMRQRTNDELVFDIQDNSKGSSVNPHVGVIENNMYEGVRNVDGYLGDELTISLNGQRVEKIIVDDIEEPQELRELRQKIPAEQLERESKRLNMIAAQSQVEDFIKKMAKYEDIRHTDLLNAVLAMRDESTRNESVFTVNIDKEVARNIGQAATAMAPHLSKLKTKTDKSSGKGGAKPQLPKT